MKIIQKYKLFEHKNSYKASENGSGAINHSINIQVFVTKALNAQEWSPAIEVTLIEDGKGKSEARKSNHTLDELSIADIDTTDYAINNFTPEGFENYESAPIHFYLSDSLVLELETRSKAAHLFTKGKERSLVYAFQTAEELQGFIDLLREGITQIEDFMKKAAEE